jgi:mono/diheme cytochrome c family protein
MKKMTALAGAMIALILSADLVSAAPLVAAFERFHSKEASEDGGRLLFNELACVNCHQLKTGLPPRSGPSLAGVSARVNAAWLRSFLANPSGAHEGSGMPGVLHGYAGADVDAVVHYLGSLKPKSAAKPKAARHSNGFRGGELFHSIGCVACHAPRQKSEAAEAPDEGSPIASVALPDLRAKTSILHLADFLLEPGKIRPDGRMPKLVFNEEDATDIASYLFEFTSSDPRLAAEVAPFQSDPALVERGRKVVAEARCAACHELPKDVAVQSVPLKKSDGGCLSGKAVRGTPDYGLSEIQSAALRRFLSARSLEMDDRQTALLTSESLNCVACHERDGLGGPDAARKPYFEGDHNLGDTGRYPPPLTAVGRKLEIEWTRKVLEGGNRVRTYLKTRMPVYGAAVGALPELLERADAVAASPLPGGDDTAGRKLLGTAGGMGCITCHRWGQNASLGIQGMDLSNMGQRLRPGWLLEYLVDPAGYRPGTLMPSFWPGGKSSNTTILDGDTARQIASIYSFAKSANGAPEGFPERSSGEFELVPKERPIVQRTFLEGVGTHAILVGFPTGVHMAYDGRSGRPAIAWKGRFFDAYNTWFSRFAPFESPLESNIVRWPAGDEAASGSGLSFEGYRLLADGSPVFVSTRNGNRIEDRFEGVKGGLRRTVSSSDPEKEPAVSHPSDVRVVEDGENKKGRRSFTYLWQ